MNMKLIPLIFIILSLVISGCIEKPSPAAPTAAPTVIETPVPTVTIETPAPVTPVSTPSHEQAGRIPVTYKTFVDSDYGFYRILAINAPAPSYVNNTLTINAGDTIIWVNDDNDRYTIISEEGLWEKNDPNAKLLWEYREFNYTFTKPGTYNIKLLEYPRKQQQIIVN